MLMNHLVENSRVSPHDQCHTRIRTTHIVQIVQVDHLTMFGALDPVREHLLPISMWGLMAYHVSATLIVSIYNTVS